MILVQRQLRKITESNLKGCECHTWDFGYYSVGSKEHLKKVK